ncbi:hypothetical protein GOV05_00880 [Candidatus Woesearchaeota archaeon]|nr:hypothetical protein [Candidatus Woesearchaeota archaeon]
MLGTNKSRKAQIWVSAVIYILIISTSLILVLKVGMPIIDRIKDKGVFEKTKNTMAYLDEQITYVANEGEGSQRIVSVDIPSGNLFVENNQVVWEFDTDTQVLDERSSQEVGNLKIISNANVHTYDYGDRFVLSTLVDYKDTIPVYFNVTIRKIGSEEAWAGINASDLITSINYDGVSPPGSFNLYFGNDPSTATGVGYTYMTPSSNNTNVGQASVTAHISSVLGVTPLEYDLIITLNSYADFLVLETKNIEIG